MNKNVHSAALRAAAKVAFSVAFIGGCSAAAPEVADGEPPVDGVEPSSTESDLVANANKKRKPKAPTGTSCHGDGPTTPKATCEAVVNAAFPTEGLYPGTKQSVSEEVQTCCVELLGKSGGALASHRWDCCANLPAGAPEDLLGAACTPWGPPVPPSLKRRAKPAVRPEAWRSLDVVA